MPVWALPPEFVSEILLLPAAPLSAAVFANLTGILTFTDQIDQSIAVQKEETYMDINEFAQKVCGAVRDRLSGDHRVELKEVRKNNGVRLHGLLVSTEDQKAVPTIYLDHFFRAYEEGMTFAEVIRRLTDICGQEAPEKNVDMEFFKDFEKVKNRICFRLIGRTENEELLREIPYVEFLDMAVCFFYAYRGETLGEGSILICNSHRELWGCSVDELMELANRNTPLLFPWQCWTMEEVVGEAFTGDFKKEQTAEEIPMRVLSNRQKQNGAGCLLYPDVLEQLAEKCRADLYILPSSVHETILLADSGQEEPEKLKAMICEVNRTQVAPEEVLTDSLYRYRRTGKRVEIVL